VDENQHQVLKKLTTTMPDVVLNRCQTALETSFPVNQDLEPLIEKLEQGIFEGDRLQGFIGDVYKVRVGSIDWKKGKSGGFRILYYTVTETRNIWLLHIYAKANQLNPTPQKMREQERKI
jgi:mRNA-degrading endonuclease RelE of RelBE toxin-antitoxin system